MLATVVALARRADGRDRVCVGADMAASVGVWTGLARCLRIYGSGTAVPIRGTPHFTLSLTP
ncbi:hypothetical protein GCM10010215_29810 [Streptomyces virginiae]|uniref:Uncharacterized protein n=1 Tax=Streptomyces virginiae TaxID=1961 RepID=A0ABQ3NIY8_STRVG|nr:hypothetical protein GCM10010215_29810 [Streptomyces virginiae]GHI12736.1 hypothetical protein Scinn_21990 [Streptomyces virginiae]GLV96205.1 hypothetical protein Slala04_76580 [Streptomyces lavendulae subsp. lavendulae]